MKDQGLISCEHCSLKDRWHDIIFTNLRVSCFYLCSFSCLMPFSFYNSISLSTYSFSSQLRLKRTFRLFLTQKDSSSGSWRTEHCVRSVGSLGFCGSEGRSMLRMFLLSLRGSIGMSGIAVCYYSYHVYCSIPLHLALSSSISLICFCIVSP